MTTRTKLVCTLGPATNTPKFIRGLVTAGASIFRINFSHGSSADHARAVELVGPSRRRATERSPSSPTSPVRRCGSAPCTGIH